MELVRDTIPAKLLPPPRQQSSNGGGHLEVERYKISKRWVTLMIEKGELTNRFRMREIQVLRRSISSLQDT
ncbi:unnamed protein product [Coffea canephora]|uniref:Uncharacterized protein n=1 Tax=Coffea canephora TaxID=49390 RepID=A0A068V299_COFCA|nr:unnamed protein product [Coffea canephora]